MREKQFSFIKAPFTKKSLFEALQKFLALKIRIEKLFTSVPKSAGSYSNRADRKSRVIFVFYQSFAALACTTAYIFLINFKNGVRLYPFPVLFTSIVYGLLYFKKYSILEIFCTIWCFLLPNIQFVDAANLLCGPVVIFYAGIAQYGQTRSRWSCIICIFLNVVLFRFVHYPRIIKTLATLSQNELMKCIKTLFEVSLTMGLILFLAIIVSQMQTTKAFRRLEKLKEELSSKNRELKKSKQNLQEALVNLEMAILSFSHELRNSLNAVLGNVSLAIESDDPEEVKNHLITSKFCGEILKNYIGNILDAGMMSNNTLRTTIESTDTQSLLKEVWQLVKQQAQNKRIKPLMTVNSDIPSSLELDKERFLQCVLNLTSNAVKFTSDGSVIVSIKWEQSNCHLSVNSQECIFSQPKSAETDTVAFQNKSSIVEFNESPEPEKHLPYCTLPVSSKYNDFSLIPQQEANELPKFKDYEPGLTGYIKIRVTDTGCGMSPEKIGKLFKRFCKVENTELASQKGTGLGLWITKELAYKMNGDVTVQSIEGKGSSFELKIWTRTAKRQHRKSSTLSHIPNDYLRIRGAESEFNHINALSQLRPKIQLPITGKIIIADDDVFNVELLGNYLKKLQMHYETVNDGDALVKKVKESMPDEISLIITDNNMPKKDGIEAARDIAQFLQRYKRKLIPIVIVSGDYRLHGGHKSYENGIIHYFSKPLEFQKLKSMIT